MPPVLLFTVAAMTVAALFVLVGIQRQQPTLLATGLLGMVAALVVGFVMTLPVHGPSVEQRGVLALILDKQFDRSCALNGAALSINDQNINCFEVGDFRVWYENTDADVRYYVAKLAPGSGEVILNLIFERDVVLRGDTKSLSFERQHLDWNALKHAFSVGDGAV